MKPSFGIIKFINLLLKVIYLFQWLLLAAIIISFFLIALNSKLIDINKLAGFKINYSLIDIGRFPLDDGLQHQVTLTNGTGRLHINNYPQKIIYIKMLGAAIETIAYIYIIFLLKRIFANLKKNNFFIRENGISITKIGFVIIGITIFMDIFRFLISRFISKTYIIPTLHLKPDINFHLYTIFIGFIILVIAQIFIKGCKLREEQELTI